MRFAFSSRHRKLGAVAGFGILLIAAPGVQADSILRFDASKGSCSLLDVAPVVECDMGTSPSIDLGPTRFEREVRGNKVRFAFPDAAGKTIRIVPEGTAWRITWGSELLAAPLPATPAPATSAPTAAATPPAAGPPAAGPATAGTPAPVAPTPPAEQDLTPNNATVITTTPSPSAAAPATTPQLAGAPSATVGGLLTNFVKAKLPDVAQKDFIYDFSIPESPGFVVLGLTPDNVAHPRTIRDFVLTLKDGVDESGNFKAGLALDIAPLQLLSRDQLLEDYLDVESIQKEMEDARMRGRGAPRERLFSRPDQILTNTTLSFATSQGTGDKDETVDLGVGLHIPLLDRSDLRDWIGRCYEGTARDLFFAAPVVDAGGIPKLAPGTAEQFEAEAQNCFDASKSQARWNASIWTVSLGYALSSTEGDFGSVTPANRGAWSSFAYGFERGPSLLRKYGQLVLHAKALYKETVPDPDDDSLFIEQDSTTVGLAFKLGKPDFNASLQASFARLKDKTHDTTDEVHRLSIGLEYRVKPDLWLVATVGGEGGRDNGENNSFVLGGLKFGSRTNPKLSPNP